MQWLTAHLELLGFFLMGLFAFWRVRRHQKKLSYAKSILEKVTAEGGEPISLHPDIDPVKCAGCAACTVVCPEGDILALVDHKAVLIGPSRCVGHGECEKACPTGAITLVFGSKTRGVDIPRVTTHYETNVPGLYIAGELGGMGLIRNAVRQGVSAANHALENLPSKKDADYDILIVGAGPAGIAASLACVVQKKKYLTVEQNSFGGTVFNYPRQKIVMSHPAVLPLVGTMKFSKNKISKEELLDYWNGIRKQAGVEIKEHTKFEGLEKRPNHFLVKTSRGEFTASKVILAMGVRGSPRKLGVPNEDSSKVAYNLLDPEEYQGKKVCVVGGGNAGVEAAQSLGKKELKNDVTLLVRGKILDRCNETNQKIINDMASQGLVKLWYESSVVQIEKNSLLINKQGTNLEIENDFLFVFAGAELPNKFLMALGIQIDIKFGEGLKNQA